MSTKAPPEHPASAKARTGLPFDFTLAAKARIRKRNVELEAKGLPLTTPAPPGAFGETTRPLLDHLKSRA